jgi:hypothetical protein
MGKMNGTALRSHRKPLATVKINAADKLQMPEYRATTTNPCHEHGYFYYNLKHRWR